MRVEQVRRDIDAEFAHEITLADRDFLKLYPLVKVSYQEESRTVDAKGVYQRWNRPQGRTVVAYLWLPKDATRHMMWWEWVPELQKWVCQDE